MSLGLFNLGTATITAAVTDSILTSSNFNGAAAAFIGGLGGMQSATFFAKLIYGSGGTSISVVIQTSLNQSDDWIDICRFDFTTANAQKHATVGVFANAAPAAVAALNSEGKLDNILGDRLRAKVTSVGTYASNTSISVRVATR